MLICFSVLQINKTISSGLTHMYKVNHLVFLLTISVKNPLENSDWCFSSSLWCLMLSSSLRLSRLLKSWCLLWAIFKQMNNSKKDYSSIFLMNFSNIYKHLYFGFGFFYGHLLSCSFFYFFLVFRAFSVFFLFSGIDLGY